MLLIYWYVVKNITDVLVHSKNITNKLVRSKNITDILVRTPG